MVADGKIGQRICYYEDKAYTAGAVIKVDDVLLVCSDENDYETNGSLKWVVLKQRSDLDKNKASSLLALN